ncbi:hypothetical protein GLOIN_2v1731439 [Rhizophagus clarus]|uniref:DUF7431 domain-containing protein n=1 Tax=Rhizophagus clarus TaxID=94130 RepID=A0A8H3LDU9_9GLOM|nr:hypothetical protein GLOIN_2v1731439 [Rhizophagus clarus]
MPTEKNIKVIVRDNKCSLLRLNTADKLEKIREILEDDEKIKMDDEILFSQPDFSGVVENNKESELSLKDIIKNNTLCLTPTKIINVIVRDDGRSSSLQFDTADKLKRIREILEKDEKIKMDDELLFSQLTDSSGIIERNKESELSLNDIIKNNTLCLIPTKIIKVIVRDDIRSSSLRLDIANKLKKIREILEKDEKIKMDYELSFSQLTGSSGVVERNKESDLSLKDIIKNNTLYLIPTKIIKVRVIEDAGKSSLLRLDTADKLKRIREILEGDEKIKMDYKLSFSWSIDSSDIKDAKEVKRDEESDLSLKNIIGDSTLYLIKKHDYSDLKDRLGLGHGRILTPNEINIKISKEEVCTMEIIELEKSSLDHGGSKKDGDFNSKKGWVNKISAFFNGKVEMMNYGSTGLTLHEECISYKSTKIPKITLKLGKFQPNPMFIEEVEKALKSNNQKNFDKIYKDFGQFIPTEVTLGGIVYYETSSEVTESVLIGENRLSLIKFDKDEWIKSLEKHDTWECIEFRNPKSIFEILDEGLREEVCKFFGKKILYYNAISYKCHLEHGYKVKVELPYETIKDEKADCSVFATVVDEEEKKNDFFNCQIYHPQNEKSQLIIHCFQKNHQTSRQLKIAFMIVGYDINFNPNNFNDFNDFNGIQLKVLKNTRVFKSVQRSSFLGIPVLKELNDKPIVIGHYFSKNKNEDNIETNEATEINVEANVFSYNLSNKQYDEPSNFDFHVLVISGIPKTYGTFPFTKIDLEKWPNIGTEKNKYISVYSVDESCGPIFLKQKKKEFKLKHVTCKCNKPYISKKMSKSKTCILCENTSDRTSKEVNCTYFVSTISSPFPVTFLFARLFRLDINFGRVFGQPDLWMRGDLVARTLITGISIWILSWMQEEK